MKLGRILEQYIRSQSIVTAMGLNGKCRSLAFATENAAGCFVPLSSVHGTMQSIDNMHRHG